MKVVLATSMLIIACALAVLVSLAACNESKGNAHREAAKWSRDYDCLNVSGYKQSDLSFCLAGRALVVCDMDRCLTVPLDAIAEKP